MALLFHELATNAAKYGALSKPAGQLSVVWFVSEGQLRLNWRETGGPTVCAPNHRGFGMRLLSGALDQIDGKLDMCFDPAGLICTISLNLAKDSPSRVREMERLKAFVSG